MTIMVGTITWSTKYEIKKTLFRCGIITFVVYNFFVFIKLLYKFVS